MSAQLKRYTEAEYLLMERASSIRHEFYQGRIYAMTGASKTHNLIVSNTLAAFHGQLRRRPCQVYANDMRVTIPRTSLFTYPDVLIVCGQPLFRDTAQDTLINPTVIVEVLSPSTERYDRGMKFQHYRLIETLHDYLLIAQDQQRIEHFAREATGQWLLRESTSPDQLVELASVACTLSLADVFEKVEFPAAEAGVTRDIPEEP